MITAPDFAAAIGRKKLADAFDVGATAVSNFEKRGWFPSSWLLVCQELASEKGIECPPELFKMRVRTSPTVDKSVSAQGGRRKNTASAS